MDNIRAKNNGILILENDDEEAEIEFELNYWKKLSIEDRFKLMQQKNRELVKLLEDNGHRRPAEIIKRT